MSKTKYRVIKYHERYAVVKGSSISPKVLTSKTLAEKLCALWNAKDEMPNKIR